MEPIQDQVTILTEKVDALHQLINQINSRVSDILNAKQPVSSDSKGQPPSQSYRVASAVGGMSDELFVHKDILMDSAYPERDFSGDEQGLSPEVQIQRLTAQLTAAYNRIAALEEQLLAARTH